MAGEPTAFRVPTRVTLGRTEKVISVENQVAGTYRYIIGVDTDSVYASLYVETVNSGSLTVNAITYNADYTETKTAPVFSFPVLSAPTGGLVLKKGAAVMSWLEFVVTSTGTTSYEIYVKGISAGETDVKISSAEAASSSSTTVSTTPGLIIPTSLTDRSGLIIKNWTSGSILYIGFTALEASVSNGYPLVYGESLGMDLSAGATLYGVGTQPIDVRILQAGG